MAARARDAVEREMNGIRQDEEQFAEELEEIGEHMAAEPVPA